MSEPRYSPQSVGRRPWRRRLAWLVPLLALAAVGLWAGLLRPPEGEPVATISVRRGDIEKTVTAVGALQPKDYVDVGTQVSGQLQAVHVAVGDRVHKGDLIAEIDPTRYESIVRNDRAALASLRAQLQQREAELELARLQLERNQRMVDQKAVSQDSVDQARANAKVAEAALAVLHAQIAAAEATLQGDLANLGYTRIFAPMDGTVVAQIALQGQTVNAAQSAPVIVRIANLDVMTVWAQVAEADVNQIGPGTPVYFTTLGQPERRWHGQVRQVQPTPEIQNDVVLYNALIDVDNAEHLLLPSMTVQVFFVLASAEQVPVVALSALRADRQAGPGHYQATVLTAQGPQPREVIVGVANRTQAEVVSGLEVGEQVLVDSLPAAAPNHTRVMPPHL